MFPPIRTFVTKDYEIDPRITEEESKKSDVDIPVLTRKTYSLNTRSVKCTKLFTATLNRLSR
jgi:hypothetical protein